MLNEKDSEIIAIAPSRTCWGTSPIEIRPAHREGERSAGGDDNRGAPVR